MIQMVWTDRKFSFDFPIGVFPGIIERLRGTPARIGELVHGVPHNMLTRRLNNQWSVNEHIGHLIDLDELDHKRLDELLAGASQLSAADMSNRRTYDAKYNDVLTATLIEYFRARRHDLVERLEALSEEEIAKRSLHPRLQTQMRVVDWAYFVAEHDDHHLARIRELT
jgi:hypothetical protein